MLPPVTPDGERKHELRPKQLPFDIETSGLPRNSGSRGVRHHRPGRTDRPRRGRAPNGPFSAFRTNPDLRVPGRATARCRGGTAPRRGEEAGGDGAGQLAVQLPTEGLGLGGPLTVKPNAVDWPALSVRL